MCNQPGQAPHVPLPFIAPTKLNPPDGATTRGRVIAAEAAADIISKEKSLPPGVKKPMVVDHLLRECEGLPMRAPALAEKAGKAVSGRVGDLRKQIEKARLAAARGFKAPTEAEWLVAEVAWGAACILPADPAPASPACSQLTPHTGVKRPFSPSPPRQPLATLSPPYRPPQRAYPKPWEQQPEPPAAPPQPSVCERIETKMGVDRCTRQLHRRLEEERLSETELLALCKEQGQLLASLAPRVEKLKTHNKELEDYIWEQGEKMKEREFELHLSQEATSRAEACIANVAKAHRKKEQMLVREELAERKKNNLPPRDAMDCPECMWAQYSDSTVCALEHFTQGIPFYLRK